MLLVLTLVAAMAGLASIPLYLIHFAVTTRRDPMTPDACGRGARWARRAAGMSVQRATP